MAADAGLIRSLPKVALHEHLDGALRPATIIELAAEAGHRLPTDDRDALGAWFFAAADSGSLVRYLETFTHTIACMQTYPHLRRVAREFVEDQAADGVVYAEARWAPEQHLAGGLTLPQAVEAVRDGLADGMDAAARAGRPIVAQQIVSSMRHLPPRRDVAQLAIDFRHDSVCGFDIAGPEDGFPPSLHLVSFDLLHRANVPVTIHAGEAFGLASIWEAVAVCGATRLGHGVRLVEDISHGPAGYLLGDLAAYIRDRRIALEVCPTSNVQTGICATIADHPIDLLVELGFRVTVSCDNRLMSGTSLTAEFGHLCDAFDYGLPELLTFTRNAAKSAFYPYDLRRRLISDVIEPAFARAGVRR